MRKKLTSSFQKSDTSAEKRRRSCFRKSPTPEALDHHVLPEIPTSVTARLGIVGWEDLEPVLLAALAIRGPVLLIGPHGIAKSMVVERIARALRLRFGHYNSALISYDDLVGIPIPVEGAETLTFARTAASIWDVEFAFFDEISRARPDLQNKVFPIVHERRVMGIDLTMLAHCWAAMNPPLSAGGIEHGEPIYVGSEELDVALADRFAFIIRVPTWDDLSRADKYQMLMRSGSVDAELLNVELTDLIALIRSALPHVDAYHRASVAKYVMLLMDRLRECKLPLSPRRGNTLVQDILAVHTARLVIGDECDSITNSAWLAVQNAIPQTCSAQPPSLTHVLAAHRQVLDVLAIEEGNPLREVFMEVNALRRIEVAEDVGLSDDLLSRLVTMALSKTRDEQDLTALATALFLRYRHTKDLTPSAFAILQEQADSVLNPSTAFLPNSEINQDAYRDALRYIAAHLNTDESRIDRLVHNMILHGLKNDWTESEMRRGEQLLRQYVERFVPRFDSAEVA